MPYQVELSSRARKDLDKLDAAVRKRVLAALKEMPEEPRPPGCKKLRAHQEHAYRIRVGDHRILYTIQDALQTVCVLRVLHRREAYR